MLSLFLNILILIVMFYILIKVADIFVEYSSRLGKFYGMSSLLVGLTIVAIGSSLPELITSLGSFFFTENYSDFIIGTSMGSNITNILLAFGLYLVLSKKFTLKNDESFSVAILFFTTFIFILFVGLGFSNYLVVGLFFLYIFYVYKLKFDSKKKVKEDEDEVSLVDFTLFKSWLWVLTSIFIIFGAAKMIVFSIENIGRILDIPISYLSLTVISIATSLPEIMITFIAVKKKRHSLAVGNILGTNIMNVCLIIGTSGFFGRYLITTSNYFFSIIFFSISTILFGYMILTRRYNKYFGWIFILMYILYMLSFFI